MFIPVNVKKHWLLFVVDMEARKLLEYDSYRNRLHTSNSDPESPRYFYRTEVQKLRSVLRKYEV